MTVPSDKNKNSSNHLLNWGLLLFSCVFAFAVAEVGARILFQGSNLGWYNSKSVFERIKDCKNKNGNVAVLGDSFVEYFKGTPSNMTQVVEKSVPEYRSCNFGFSGTGFDDYLVKWEKIAEKNIVEKAVFVIFTGNDYDDYFLRYKEEQIENPATTGPLPVKGILQQTSKKSTVFTILKRSVALNALWRFGYKKWFPQRSFDAAILTQDEYYGSKFSVPPEVIKERMAKIPKELVAAARSDHINVHILKRAVFDPAFFQRIHAGYGTYGPSILLNLQDRTSKIVSLCKKNQIKCGFVFVEVDVFTDTQHHPFYTKLGYQLGESQIGPSRISVQLQDFMSAHQIPYATSFKALQEDPEYFLPQDGHLSVKGHQVLGLLIANFLNTL